MNQSTVTTVDGKVTTVKNLGYIFRNWKTITQFQVSPGIDGNEFTLKVFFADGRIYETQYASWETSTQLFWLRSIFDGIPINFYNCCPQGVGGIGFRSFGLESELSLVQVWSVGYFGDRGDRRGYSLSYNQGRLG